MTAGQFQFVTLGKDAIDIGSVVAGERHFIFCLRRNQAARHAHLIDEPVATTTHHQMQANLHSFRKRHFLIQKRIRLI